jgi:hypothetical protein
VRERWSRPAWQMLPYLLAAAFWLSPLTSHPTSVAFWRGGAYSDLLISHWPNAILLHRGIFEIGPIPLWNPSILSGTPFAADPLSVMWYLPNWIAVVFPSALAFNVLFWLHLTWAGWGTARLARAEGVGRTGALVAGLAFGGAPKLIGHIGLGHLGLVEAVCWTPWLLVLVGGAADGLRDGEASWPRRSALAGAVMGVTFLADPRWLVPAGMVVVAYAIMRIAHSQQDAARSPHWGRLMGGAAIYSAEALGIAACLGVPLLEFLRLSTRAVLTQTERVALSLPWDRVARLLLPDFGAWPEWLAYPGVVVVVLAVLGVLARRRAVLFWWGVAIFGVLLALGGALPIYPAAAALIPGLSLLRVPARFLFLTSLGLAVLAGFGLEAVLHARDEALARRRLLWMGSAAGVLIVLVDGAYVVTSGASDVFVRARGLAGIALVALAFGWMVAMLRGAVRAKVGAAGWVFLVCVDLGLMALATFRIVPVSEAIESELSQTVARLAGGSRVVSPSYSLSQPGAMLAGLELADGIDPMQLASYRDFMGNALGFNARDYSVTLPPYPEGDPTQPWDVTPDAERLGLLNVAYVISAYPLRSEELTLEGRQGDTYIYSNPEVRPKAWMQSSANDTTSWTPVDQIERSTDGLRIRAQGPGRLVVSEVAYPGWRATVDGRATPIEMAYDILQAVQLPEGLHDVVFDFRPTSVYAGAGISLLSVVALAWLWIRR